MAETTPTSTTTSTDTGYVNGSDILLKAGDNAFGHCTSHKMTYSSETKEHSVKPEASKAKSKALFKNKTVTSMSISISVEGLRFYNETENGPVQVAAMWGKGDSVDVEAFERGKDSAPYLRGNFVITSIEEDFPAQDDATYTVQLENDGEPSVYPGKATA